MTDRLSRLLRPRSIAVVGGGVWCRQVVEQSLKIGFDGAIWPVHPERKEMAGLPAFQRVEDLPAAPDAAFIGVNRKATIPIVQELENKGAGGAVCFASGFLEIAADDPAGALLQDQLIEAADAMPLLGPNCYGFLNYLDGALLWPDQHGGERVERGVAIITQSSNIALNLTMQTRALPIAYIATVGNQATVDLASLGSALLADERVTALGCHIEGFKDLRAFEALAAEAARLGKPIIALKVGKSAEAGAATTSHTASLAGSDAAASALLARLGIGRATSLAGFLEALKLLHVLGPLASTRIASLSCSGGEAALVADAAFEHGVALPPLKPAQEKDLRGALGSRVPLANPLDYQTHIWHDVDALTATFAAMADQSLALTLIVLDFPRDDRCDPAAWDHAVTACIEAKRSTGRPFGMLSSLPENLPEVMAQRLMSAGIVPFHGLDAAFEAIRVAAELGLDEMAEPVLIGRAPNTKSLLSERNAKKALETFGLKIPRSISTDSADAAVQAADAIGFPVVLKGEGIAHKSERGAVAVGLQSADDVMAAAAVMPTERFLVEEMVGQVVAELLIGIVRDDAGSFVLTLAAGGVLTELLQDGQSLLVPATAEMIDAALDRLRIGPVLRGYRGAPAADRDAVIEAALALQAYAIAHADGLAEVEINPLLCCPDKAVAGDALIEKET